MEGSDLDNAHVEFCIAETADLIRKHGGKTGEELKAEGKWPKRALAARLPKKYRMFWSVLLDRSDCELMEDCG